MSWELLGQELGSGAGPNDKETLRLLVAQVGGAVLKASQVLQVQLLAELVRDDGA